METPLKKDFYLSSSSQSSPFSSNCKIALFVFACISCFITLTNTSEVPATLNMESYWTAFTYRIENPSKFQHTSSPKQFSFSLSQAYYDVYFIGVFMAGHESAVDSYFGLQLSLISSITSPLSGATIGVQVMQNNQFFIIMPSILFIKKPLDLILEAMPCCDEATTSQSQLIKPTSITLIDGQAVAEIRYSHFQIQYSFIYTHLYPIYDSTQKGFKVQFRLYYSSYKNTPRLNGTIFLYNKNSFQTQYPYYNFQSSYTRNFFTQPNLNVNQNLFGKNLNTTCLLGFQTVYYWRNIKPTLIYTFDSLGRIENQQSISTNNYNYLWATCFSKYECPQSHPFYNPDTKTCSDCQGKAIVNQTSYNNNCFQGQNIYLYSIDDLSAITFCRNCTNCKNKHVSVDGYCKECSKVFQNCLDCQENQGCILCQTGYVKRSGLCRTCGQEFGQQCISCDQTTDKCTECKAGYYLDSDSSDICIRCSDQYQKCLDCQKDQGCILCQTGYISSSGLCRTCGQEFVKQCISCDQTTDKCTECKAGYYLDSDSSDICIRCSDQYQKCLNCQNDKGCILCQTGYVSRSGLCRTCGQEFGQWCTSCDQNTCTGCVNTFTLIEGKCECSEGRIVTKTCCPFVGCISSHMETRFDGRQYLRCYACDVRLFFQFNSKTRQCQCMKGFVLQNTNKPEIQQKCVNRCGDGLIDKKQGERCDDKNRISNDGCSDRCRIQPGYICRYSQVKKKSICGYYVTEFNVEVYGIRRIISTDTFYIKFKFIPNIRQLRDNPWETYAQATKLNQSSIQILSKQYDIQNGYLKVMCRFNASLSAAEQTSWQFCYDQNFIAHPQCSQVSTLLNSTNLPLTIEQYSFLHQAAEIYSYILGASCLLICLISLIKLPTMALQMATLYGFLFWVRLLTVKENSAFMYSFSGIRVALGYHEILADQGRDFKLEYNANKFYIGGELITKYNYMLVVMLILMTVHSAYRLRIFFWKVKIIYYFKRGRDQEEDLFNEAIQKKKTAKQQSVNFFKKIVYPILAMQLYPIMLLFLDITRISHAELFLYEPIVAQNSAVYFAFCFLQLALITYLLYNIIQDWNRILKQLQKIKRQNVPQDANSTTYTTVSSTYHLTSFITFYLSLDWNENSEGTPVGVIYFIISLSVIHLYYLIRSSKYDRMTHKLSGIFYQCIILFFLGYLLALKLKGQQIPQFVSLICIVVLLALLTLANLSGVYRLKIEWNSNSQQTSQVIKQQNKSNFDEFILESKVQLQQQQNERRHLQFKKNYKPQNNPYRQVQEGKVFGERPLLLEPTQHYYYIDQFGYKHFRLFQYQRPQLIQEKKEKKLPKQEENEQEQEQEQEQKQQQTLEQIKEKMRMGLRRKNIVDHAKIQQRKKEFEAKPRRKIPTSHRQF